MMYLIGGAPRVGKTILAQQLCTTRSVGWISTDLLMDLLRVAQLSTQYPIRAVFLGCSRMTLEDFTRFPGRSKGYIDLPEAHRRQIVEDVPRWSAFIRQEAERLGYPYVDMAGDFSQHLTEAELLLTVV